MGRAPPSVSIEVHPPGLAVAKNANTVLKKEVKRLQKDVIEMRDDIDFNYKRDVEQNQYTRRENIELVNIPSSVEDINLKETVVTMLNNFFNEPISKRDISTCQRLYDKKKTIIRFLNRDYATEMLDKADTIKEFDFADIFTMGQRIYCNCNLSPESKHLYWKLKMLKSDGYVAFFGAEGRGVYYQKQKNGKKYFVYGDSDLYKFVKEDEWASYFGEYEEEL